MEGALLTSEDEQELPQPQVEQPLTQSEIMQQEMPESED